MKFAIRATELLTRTILVEADTYEDAEDIVVDAFNHGKIVFHEDNSAFELNCENDTKEYIEIFGKEVFEQMNVELRETEE